MNKEEGQEKGGELDASRERTLRKGMAPRTAAGGLAHSHRAALHAGPGFFAF